MSTNVWMVDEEDENENEFEEEDHIQAEIIETIRRSRTLFTSWIEINE